MTIKQSLMANLGLTEEDFGSYRSDLFVKEKPGVYRHIRDNFPVMKIEKYVGEPKSEWDGIPFFIIPFGFMDEYIEIRRPK